MTGHTEVNNVPGRADIFDGDNRALINKQGKSLSTAETWAYLGLVPWGSPDPGHRSARILIPAVGAAVLGSQSIAQDP
jgi:hypothetical protein